MVVGYVLDSRVACDAEPEIQRVARTRCRAAETERMRDRGVFGAVRAQVVHDEHVCWSIAPARDAVERIAEEARLVVARDDGRDLSDRGLSRSPSSTGSCSRNVFIARERWISTPFCEILSLAAISA